MGVYFYNYIRYDVFATPRRVHCISIIWSWPCIGAKVASRMLIMNRRCDAERQEGVAYYMMPRYHLVNVTVSVREDLFWKRFGNLNKRTSWNTIPLNPCLTARTPRLLIEECREVKAKQFLGLNAVWIRTGVNPTSSMKCRYHTMKSDMTPGITECLSCRETKDIDGYRGLMCHVHTKV